MKKNLCYLLLSPLLFSATACLSGGNGSGGEPKPEDLGPVDVVVISGQSNAVGCTKSIYLADTMPEKYDEYFNGYPSIQIAFDSWTKDWLADGSVTFYSQNRSSKNGFVKTALGQGNGKSTFGPEIGIAESLHEQYANKLFLIKYACGASNLQDDWAERKSPMYGRFINYVKYQMDSLTKKGYTPTIRAFCWMQGEGDTYPNYHNHYLDNLREFVSNIRTDLGEMTGGEELPFIDAGISAASMWQYSQQVNNAKVAFASESENNFFIDTIGAGLHTDQEPEGSPDEAHYDSESQIELGHLFAEAIKPFLS